MVSRVWFVLLLFLVALLFLAAGVSLLAAAVTVSAPLPGQPVDPKEDEQDFRTDPEPPVLTGSEEHAFVGQPMRLLALQFHLQQPSHLLLLLLLILLHELLRGHISPLTHSQHGLKDAQHGQDVGDAQSHGLEEKGEREGAERGWVGEREMVAAAAGAVDAGARGWLGEGWKQLGGSKGKVGECCADGGTSLQHPTHWPWLAAPGTSAPSPKASTCPAQGAPRSACALAPA